MYWEVDPTCMSGGCTDTPVQGQTQCVISVPQSDTRCQWSAAQGSVKAGDYCSRFLCFLGLSLQNNRKHHEITTIIIIFANTLRIQIPNTDMIYEKKLNVFFSQETIKGLLSSGKKKNSLLLTLCCS